MHLTEVLELLNANYGIKGSCEQLNGERDLNFRVKNETGSFIFKIQQAQEADFISFQNKILHSLANSDLNVTLNCETQLNRS